VARDAHLDPLAVDVHHHRPPAIPMGDAGLAVIVVRADLSVGIVRVESPTVDQEFTIGILQLRGIDRAVVVIVDVPPPPHRVSPETRFVPVRPTHIPRRISPVVSVAERRCGNGRDWCVEDDALNRGDKATWLTTIDPDAVMIPAHDWPEKPPGFRSSGAVSLWTKSGGWGITPLSEERGAAQGSGCYPFGYPAPRSRRGSGVVSCSQFISKSRVGRTVRRTVWKCMTGRAGSAAWVLASSGPPNVQRPPPGPAAR
jgi:hypothetical protein